MPSTPDHSADPDPDTTHNPEHDSAFAPHSSRRLLLRVLRTLGLTRRAIPKAVVGPKAYVQWWQRLLAVLGLTAIVLSIGITLAASMGLLLLVIGLLLEGAIV